MNLFRSKGERKNFWQSQREYHACRKTNEKDGTIAAKRVILILVSADGRYDGFRAVVELAKASALKMAALMARLVDDGARDDRRDDGRDGVVIKKERPA